MIVAPPLRRSTPQIKPLDCLSLMTILSSIDIPNSYSQVKYSHWQTTMNKELKALTKKKKKIILIKLFLIQISVGQLGASELT